MSLLDTLRGMWAGKPLSIIGGGPSIADPHGLCRMLHDAGHGLLGVNDAYLLPHVQATFYGDDKWGRLHQSRLAEWEGIIMARAKFRVAGCHHVKDTPQMPRGEALRNTLDGMGWYGNSGAAAIQIAVAAMPTEIWLHGYDGERTEAESNWHPNPLDPNPPTTYDKFRNQMARMMGDLIDRGDLLPPIWNTNEKSGYFCIPKRRFNELATH